MEKATKFFRLITAVLLAVEAGMRLHEKITQTTEEAAGEALGDGATVHVRNIGAVLRNAQERLADQLRTYAERAGRHNDAPGSD